MKENINSLIKKKDFVDVYNLSQNVLKMIYNAKEALKKLGVIKTNKLAGAEYAFRL